MTRIILLDIFSYSCMNCLRSLEYIKKIDAKYKKYGLETIIIHPPEWKFEKNRKNILQALKNLKINLPVIIDKKQVILRMFKVNFWPTQIVIKDGKILYKHIGEGNYKKLENIITKKLKIKTKYLFQKEPKYSKFPTVYCGKLKEKPIKFDGWIQKSEYIKSTKNNADIVIKTKGKIINFVAESLNKRSIIIKIKLNNKFNKKIVINKPQLYNLAKTEDSNVKELALATPKNLAIYSFSFQ